MLIITCIIIKKKYLVKCYILSYSIYFNSILACIYIFIFLIKHTLLYFVRTFPPNLLGKHLTNVILEGAQYTLKESGAIVFIFTEQDCTAKMVLYVIKCSVCNLDDIGSIKHLRHRVSLHRSQIKCKHNRTSPVSEHLDICGSVFPFLK